MMKNLFILTTMAILLVASFATAATITKDIEMNNDAGNGASAEMTVWESSSTSGVNRVRMQIKVEDLMPENAMQYEAWLIDDDTGYHRNLGVVKVSNSGRGSLRFSDINLNVHQYDRVLVTKETVPDFSPHPAVHIFSADFPVDSLANIIMEANMRGLYEVPKVITPARGSGEFTVDTVNNVLHYDITYTKLKGDETGAHIHGFALPGQNAPVLHTLPTGTHKVGSWNYPQDQEDEILSGMTYVNVHSTLYPNGEIRGQVVLD